MGLLLLRWYGFPIAHSSLEDLIHFVTLKVFQQQIKITSHARNECSEWIIKLWGQTLTSRDIILMQIFQIIKSRKGKMQFSEIELSIPVDNAKSWLISLFWAWCNLFPKQVNLTLNKRLKWVKPKNDMWSLEKVGRVNPEYESFFPLGFSLDFWNGKDSVTPVWRRCCWSSPGTAFCVRMTRDLAGTTALHQDYRNFRNIPFACCHCCTLSWLCWTCLHTAQASLVSSFWAQITYLQDFAHLKHKSSCSCSQTQP